MKYDLTSSARQPQRLFGISALSGTALTTLAVLIAAGATLPAQAQVFWGNDDYSADQRFDSQTFDNRHFDGQRPRRIARTPKHRREAAPVVKEASKPQGPPIILISIDQQKLRLYDSNGLFAESPVSTGMKGHSTPMGVFSVIGKEKFHRSNIYSGAPMPYMQRITWSGVAMHAGVLPGYPASHGCIRMPMNFAIRMYGWTRQGARVVIAPTELSPADISHPLLFTRKPDLTVAAAADVAKDLNAKDMVSTPKSDKAVADLAANAASSGTDRPDLRPTQPSGASEPIVTADASGAIPQKINDAMAKSTEPKADVDEPKKDKDQARQVGDDKSTATFADGAQPDTVKPDNVKSESATPDSSRIDAAKTDAAKTDTPKSDTPKTDKSAAAAAPKPRTGHIAAYVSRKEGKLFVRQNFEPLFDVPVEISDRDRPLGTHVFTMRADKDDAKTYRWSVISLPVRSTEAAPRRKKGAETAAQAPAAPPSTASEALDRLKIPDEAMQKIAQAIAPGGSITVSDQGLGDETGLGTDFIVPLR